MKPIDADALKEKFEDDGHLSYYIEEFIDESPTLNVVPADRLGEFGRLFQDYTGCPRGASGRACMLLEEEVLKMKPLIDVDGGEWIPVNADALRELVREYVDMRKKSGWISVKDRLPDDERRVLVSCRTKKGQQSVNLAYYWNGYWHGQGSMAGVTHWMPLPEPPEVD